MSLFDNILGNNESLFTDELALDYEYLPRLLPYREDQQHYIASCIKPLLQGRNGKNLLITGQPGIGKTAATRFVLRELEEQGLDDNIYLIYINCWKKETPHKAALEICSLIGYKYTQDKSTDQLLKETARIINKKAAVFVFDEIDKMQEFSLLYNLLDEINKKTILLITNEQSFISSLDSRISSRLSAELLEFKPYNLEETLGILKQRAEHAFIPGCWQKEALSKIAEAAFNKQDIRQGLFLLRESALIAESASSRQINTQHASQAIFKLPAIKMISSNSIDKEALLVLNLVKQHSGKSSKEIYELYNQASNKSFRTFHRKLKELASNKMIAIYNTNIKGINTAIVHYTTKE